MSEPFLLSRRQRAALLASIVLPGLAACGRESAPAAPLAQPVRLVAALSTPRDESVTATGLVRAAVEAPLAFKAGGIVAELQVSAGQHVKSGQTLARLVSSDLDAALAQARESLAKAGRDLERSETLRAKGMVSQQATQDVRAQRDVARATLTAAEFNRQQAVIVAPADGVILEKRVEARETVAAGQPVVLFGRLDRGWVVRAGVPARAAVNLAPGDMAQLSLDGHTRTLAGRIVRIAAASDARTGTVEVEVALPADAPRLVSGMVARLILTRAQARNEAVLTVPLTAVLEGNGGKAHLFVVESVGSESKARRIDVSTGHLLEGGRIEILDGLPASVRVVSEGAAWLSDGINVRILP